MKTFKLKGLTLMEPVGEAFEHHEIELIDGLTINREDEENRWVIEAYTTADYKEMFERLRKSGEDLMVEARITNPNNPPAQFITRIIGANEIGENVNVLFMGTIIDQRKASVEKQVKALIDAGYQGDTLVEKIKETL
ncbi:uncharacterized protein JNUCC1_00102 [Lentibacillus sp. JNUCC-1]|uniref:YwpF family protein n=1 Tax=Lentibacillus sp. JNUCC-1 TaxID=2654513 RepID=UPI0012E79EA5|nr:YwpF family protein [Lentibacillus sp. JNUCC-1]MUV36301.1 uncharacterized protein [Lentibacillus sp. JNUCC-1]